MSSRRVTFRLSPAHPRAVLVGEPADWVNGVPLGPDGTVTLTLPRGVYAYKFRTLNDGVWRLTEPTGRTRAQAGRRNHLVSVGGAPEPLLFAAAEPFVFVEPRGGLHLQAGIRPGAGAPLRVGYAEGDVRPGPEASAWHWLQMEPFVVEDEHQFYSVRLPCSTKRVHLAFALPSGERLTHDEDGAPFTWEAQEARSVPLPTWWSQGVVYTVFVDRFRPQGVPLSDWTRPVSSHVFSGGHLEGVTQSLDDLAALGVTVLHLTPVHLGQSCHRYDLVNPFAIDPRLGGEPAYRRLLEEAHRRNLRVLVDLSLSHVGEDFPAWQEVRTQGREAPHASLFQWNDAGDGVLRYGSRTEGPPLLDLSSPEAQAFALRVVDFWCDFDVDGFRIDAAAEIPLPLLQRMRARIRARRPGALVFAELVPAHAWRYRGAGAFDAATAFGFRESALEWLRAPSPDAAALQDALSRVALERGGPAETALHFLSTHDHPRLQSLLLQTFEEDEAEARARLGWLLLFTLPGTPALVYGEELGLSTRAAEGVPESVWENRMPMPLPAAVTERQRAHREQMRALIAARQHSPALREGDFTWVHAEGALLVFRRQADGEVLDVVLNAGPRPVTFSLEDGDRPAATLQHAVGEARAEGAQLSLGPFSGAVFRREARPAREAPLAEAEAHRRRDADFSQGREWAQALPTRLNFSLTERCNLRCLHCITQAPLRTRTGRARTLSPFLLDRLRPAFFGADTYGFVHGGETLLAPLFFEVLEAIRSERGGRATTVHLLTNGMLLTQALTERLVASGVTSLSISLDGASPETNDRLRLGSRFGDLLRNVERLTRWRRDAGAPLRVGLSCVVTAENLPELERLVELGSRLGVDWLKLEEMVPVNSASQQRLVTPGDLSAALAQAQATAERLGLLLVDHTDPSFPFRCEAVTQPKLARFFEGDDAANAAPMLPCRFPYELACVEPNGDVHLGDFFGPRLGNLAESDLETLWNGRVAQAERRRSVAQRLCTRLRLPVSCLPSTPAANATD